MHTLELEGLFMLGLSSRRWRSYRLVLLLALLTLAGGRIWRRSVPNELAVDNLDRILQLFVLHRRLCERFGLENAVQTLRRVVCVGGRTQRQS